MEEKIRTVTIKDKSGRVLLEYSDELVEPLQNGEREELKKIRDIIERDSECEYGVNDEDVAEVMEIIKDLLSQSKPVEFSRGAMENITWIKKGVWTIEELLNINISQELDRAREEGKREALEQIQRFVEDEMLVITRDGTDILEKYIKEWLSKLTTK